MAKRVGIILSLILASQAAGSQTPGGLVRQGKFDQAARILEHKHDQRPSARLKYYLAATWIAGNQHDRARPYINELLRLKNRWGRKAATLASRSFLSKALADYQNKQYAAALEAAEFAQRAKPSLESRALVGLSLVRLDQRTEARVVLAKAARVSHPVLQKEIREILAQLAVTPPIDNTVAFSSGYQSNLFGDGMSEDPASAGFSEIELESQKEFPALTVKAGVRWQEYFGQTENRWVGLSLRLQKEFRWPKWAFFPRILLDYKYLGGQTYSAEAGANLELQRRRASRMASVQYTFTRVFAPISEFRYLAGQRHELALGDSGLGLDWRPDWGFSIGREITGSLESGGTVLPLAHWALEFSVTVAGGIVGPHELHTVVSSELLIYDVPAEPGGEIRRDLEIVAGISYKYAYRPSLRFELSSRVERTISTLDENSVDDLNSLNWVVSGGLQWYP